MNKDTLAVIIQNVYDKAWKEYTHELHTKNEGELRAGSCEIVETILQTVVDVVNTQLDNKIQSRVGDTDTLTRTIKYKDKTYTINNIQVDRHLVIGTSRIAFAENKTYLDSCYLDRANCDFKKIIQALVQEGINPESIEYFIFAGQNAINENTCLTYMAEFCNDVSHFGKIEPKIFYFLKGKRQSSKPWYKIKHELDFDVIFEVYNLLLTISKK